MANILEVSDATFDSEVLQSDQPVLVDFWAPWCGPCRAIAPVIEELATENAGAVKVVKVNTDNSPQKATEYDISSIPTLLVFKGGEIVERFVGAAPKSRLQAALDQAKG